MPALEMEPTPTAAEAAGWPPRAEGADSAHGTIPGPLYAALDLGTNNCRLLIAASGNRGFRVVDAFSRIVRLGEGMESSNRLSEAGMDRAIEALRICAEKIERRQPLRLRAIATEACRRARNGGDFIQRVRRETGLGLDVISTAEEARLAVAGCAPLIDLRRDQLLIFDIGGGSTELVWANLAAAPPDRRRDFLMGRAPEIRLGPEASSWVSLPVGVATLAERFAFIRNERARFAEMVSHVDRLLKPFAASLGSGGRRETLRRMQILGASGTITTLAGVHMGLPRYNREDVDGALLEVEALERVVTRLLDLSPEARAGIPCVGEERAHQVISGAAIFTAIVRRWPTPRMRVADRGLREGLLYGLINRDRPRLAASVPEPGLGAAQGDAGQSAA